MASTADNSPPTEPHPTKPDLGVKLSHAESSKPAVRVTLTNLHPTSSITVLKWDTPLDPQAVALGIFHVVEKSTGKEVPPLGLKINRRLPPPREDLIELQPRHAATQDVVLETQGFTLEKGKSYHVQARGKWRAVWHADAADVGEENLRRMGGPSGSVNWEFESEVWDLDVQ